jgi:8-oxo-dGTP pyrophosphatase MutT (NUDIX family)
MPISHYLKGLRQRIGHELLLVPSVTAIIYDRENRILLARHAENGIWVAPGGSIDPDESPADGAAREAWEETGLLVEPLRLLGAYGGPEFRVNYANGDQVAYVMTVFECTVLEGELRPDGRETLELRYFAEAELAGLRLPSWARVVLPDAFRGRGRTHFKRATWQPPA